MGLFDGGGGGGGGIGIPGTGGGLPGVGGGLGNFGQGLPGMGDIFGGGTGGILGGVSGLAGGASSFSPYMQFQKEQADARYNRIKEMDANLAKPMDLGNRSSMLGGNGRLTGDAYLDPNAYKGNTGALDTLNSKATATGNSPWLNMQLQKQGIEQQRAMGAVGAQQNAAQAGARANLAMKGGLSGGAAERIARGGAQDLNAARQGVMAQGSTNRMNLGIQDEATKNNLLGQAVSANQAQNAQNIGLGQFNAQNTLAENNANNAFQMQKYQEQMKAYGAGKSSNAIANQGKK